MARQAASVVGIDYARGLRSRTPSQNALANRRRTNVAFIQDRVEKALPVHLGEIRRARRRSSSTRRAPALDEAARSTEVIKAQGAPPRLCLLQSFHLGQEPGPASNAHYDVAYDPADRHVPAYGGSRITHLAHAETITIRLCRNRTAVRHAHPDFTVVTIAGPQGGTS
ncbi:MAG: hypothetical protein M0C28_18915 [Candidatus Moduliflexus flocculans]|nr:hypothetical protein [Candidatus Moduliflexus flocculans]